MRLVEIEDLLCGVGSVAKAVPNFALLAFVATEQDVPIAVGPRNQCDDRFGFRESRQVIEIAVVAKREQRVAIARDFGRRRHERESAACLLAHFFEQCVATRSIDVMGVVHGGIE